MLNRELIVMLNGKAVYKRVKSAYDEGMHSTGNNPYNLETQTEQFNAWVDGNRSR